MSLKATPRKKLLEYSDKKLLFTLSIMQVHVAARNSEVMGNMIHPITRPLNHEAVILS